MAGNLRAFVSLLVALVVAMLVGCGETNRDEIENAVRSFDSALAESDGRKACDLLSASARVEIERRQDCAKLAAGLSRPGRHIAPEVRALASGKVSDVTVDGTDATAQVQAPGGYPKRSVELEETEGGWKVSDTPLGP
jgi:hypothetical protein